MRGEFVKLYGSILRSSVWQQPATTKVVWITMLALADADGVVEASIPGLAATAGVTLQECEEALRCFSSPDPYSSSPADEGRRIRPIRGGWVVINHSHYRDLRTKRQVREAQRLADKRAKATSATKQHVADVAAVATDPDLFDSGSASASASSDPHLGLSRPDPDLPDQVGSPREAGPGSHPTPEDTDSRAPTAPSRAPMPLDAAEARRCTKASQRGDEGDSRPLVIREIPADMELDDELRAEAIAAGVPSEQLDDRWRELKQGPIGGRRGVLRRELRGYIRSQFGRWRTWAETERAQARASPRRSSSRGDRRDEAMAWLLEGTNETS